MSDMVRASKRPPVLGTVSILLPCMALVLSFATADADYDDRSEEIATAAVALWSTSLPFGILIATIAWVRQERYRLLPLLGGLLSLGPLFFFLALLLSK
jgi:hypothetical protein